VSYDNPDGTVAADGEVSRCDPPTRLEMTFLARWDPEVEAEGPITHVWELESEDGATKLTVTSKASSALEERRGLRQRDHVDRLGPQDVRRGRSDGGSRLTASLDRGSGPGGETPGPLRFLWLTQASVELPRFRRGLPR
jgi:uncharacterized protein YndB with AHSA1/START domain